MKKRVFDVLVIGAGSGLGICASAAALGEKVALIDPGPFGGTCLNRGCIPSKMLIHCADIASTIRDSAKFGIKSKITKVNFKQIVSRINRLVNSDAKSIEVANIKSKNITVFKEPAKFIGKKLLQVGNEILTAKKIFICAGARPFVPPIPGLDKVSFLTSKQALKLTKQPKDLTIIGGGYIGCELAHFFEALGTKVTIIDKNQLLMKNEDGDISREFTKVYEKRFKLLLKSSILSVSKMGKTYNTKIKYGSKIKNIKSDALLVATGRIPNSDLLDLEKSNIRVNKANFIKVDKFLETDVKGVYAIGDIIGKFMFKHSANLEASFAFNNAFGKKKGIDYTAMPHAAFTSPQVAGVGFTEEDLIRSGKDYDKAIYPFSKTGYGAALQDETGFVKVLCNKSKKSLGCHIMGPNASILIHEVLIAMRANLKVDSVVKTIHIHPALSEVVQRAFGDLQ